MNKFKHITTAFAFAAGMFLSLLGASAAAFLPITVPARGERQGFIPATIQSAVDDTITGPADAPACYTFTIEQFVTVETETWQDPAQFVGPDKIVEWAHNQIVIAAIGPASGDDAGLAGYSVAVTAADLAANDGTVWVMVFDNGCYQGGVQMDQVAWIAAYSVVVPAPAPAA